MEEETCYDSDGSEIKTIREGQTLKQALEEENTKIEQLEKMSKDLTFKTTLLQQSTIYLSKFLEEQELNKKDRIFLNQPS